MLSPLRDTIIRFRLSGKKRDGMGPDVFIVDTLEYGAKHGGFTMGYEVLEKTFYRLAQLNHLSSMASWDQHVMMPPKGNEARSRAMAELSVIQTEILQDPSLEDAFDAASEEAELEPWKVANLAQMRRAWQSATAVPKKLVEAESLAASRCEHAWRSFRPENDWKGFEPKLAEVFEIQKEIAAALMDSVGSERGFENAYDALIDRYDPGTTSKRIDPIFGRLAEELPDLLQEIMARQATGPATKEPAGPIAIEKQDALSRRLMEILGFDFQAGRLDVTAHPFSGGVTEDSRVTTRYDENNLVEGLMAIIHETGHSRYETGLPREWLYQPVGRSMGMGVHESQSLFFEMQLGRSKEFVSAIAPHLTELLGDDACFEPANLHRLYTKVEPGLIRVNADEVTYPMHVILRYELERDLILGRANVSDIPERWNDAMKAYLNLDTSGNFKDGPMQDIHWPMGAVGYFPSYTLGALNAAQLFGAMKQALPDVMHDIAGLNLTPVFEWLESHVWSKGCYLSYDELMIEATGETLNATYFLEHIRQRYLA